MISVVNDTFLAKMEHNPESGRVKSRNQFFTRSADGGSTRRRPLLRLPTLEVPTTWAGARTHHVLAPAQVVGTSNVGERSNERCRVFSV